MVQTFKKTGKKHALVAVSGGIDSALTLVLTAKALKPQNVFAIYLPSKNHPAGIPPEVLSILDFALIPEENRLNIPVKEIVKKIWRAIKRNTKTAPQYQACVEPTTSDNPLAEKQPQRQKINAQIAQKNRLRLGNITARCRMLVAYDQAKRLNALVIGTENKSENLLGYFTRFGDQASDIEPLHHLYKTQVYALAKYLKLPHTIIAKAPSAELWQKQTDEQELGFSYEAADPVLYLYSEQKMNSLKIAKTLCQNQPIKTLKQLEPIINKVLERVRANHFKHQVPYLLKS